MHDSDRCRSAQSRASRKCERFFPLSAHIYLPVGFAFSESGATLYEHAGAYCYGEVGFLQQYLA